ncbi:hypothetical protein DMC30DRAFT_205711 [Rhodotorula diobovata]|uniref:Uncharacterized protein n=1 Tax=Rhodotorula diobovata TaxID=5288 RepID=A0A5C5FWX7_9BASI|nr:hypothetical protein DMC30DRAFT_205711 [Rhodotorula diobovata]
MRPSSSKVAVRPYTLPPTPPLSPVTSEGSYAESLDEHCPPPPCPTAAAVQPTRSSSSNSSQPSFLTVPPPGALVFDQRVHRYPPKPFTRRERARLWYGGLLFETLESWESLLVLRPMLPHSLTALNDDPRHRHRHRARPPPLPIPSSPARGRPSDMLIPPSASARPCLPPPPPSPAASLLPSRTKSPPHRPPLDPPPLLDLPRLLAPLRPLAPRAHRRPPPVVPHRRREQSRGRARRRFERARRRWRWEEVSCGRVVSRRGEARRARREEARAARSRASLSLSLSVAPTPYSHPPHVHSQTPLSTVVPRSPIPLLRHSPTPRPPRVGSGLVPPRPLFAPSLPSHCTACSPCCPLPLSLARPLLSHCRTAI